MRPAAAVMALLAGLVFPSSATSATTPTERITPGLACSPSGELCPDGYGGKVDVSSYDVSYPGMSEDGRFTVFVSEAMGVVPDDTNGRSDVFVYDHQNDVIERISPDVEPRMWEHNDGGFATLPVISDDGSVVSYLMTKERYRPEDKLEPWDPRWTPVWELVVHDRATGAADVIGTGDFRHPSSISADGRYVAFNTYESGHDPNDTNELQDVFVYDRIAGTYAMVSRGLNGQQGNSESYAGVLSDNGRLIIFTSWASNLVKGDTNNKPDVFVHNIPTGATHRINVGRKGQANGYSQGWAISANGRFVLFESKATNLVAGDTNEKQDVFLRDRWEKTTTRISVSAAGEQLLGKSAVGPNRDRPRGGMALSDDGRYAGFTSSASDVVPRDTNNFRDVFVYDRVSKSVRRLSVSSEGTQGEVHGSIGSRDREDWPEFAISGDGRFAAFTSRLHNIVDGDTDTMEDLFRRGPLQ